MKSKLWKIIRMEFRLTAANKAFIVLTILGPFLIAAVTVLPSVLSMKGGLGGNAELSIAVVNADPQYLEGLRPPLAQNGIRVFEAQGTVESLDAAVLTGSFDGYLILPADLASSQPIQYVSKSVSDFRLTGILQGIIGLLALCDITVAASCSQIFACIVEDRLTGMAYPPHRSIGAHYAELCFVFI